MLAHDRADDKGVANRELNVKDTFYYPYELHDEESHEHAVLCISFLEGGRGC